MKKEAAKPKECAECYRRDTCTREGQDRVYCLIRLLIYEAHHPDLRNELDKL